MKKLNEELFPGDEIEIESKVYTCVKQDTKNLCGLCTGCSLDEALKCTNIGCCQQDVILIEQKVFKPTLIEQKVFKPTLLVVGESIEILGVKLLIKEYTKLGKCSRCTLNSVISCTTLCTQVDCQTNKCIISNEIVL